MSDIVIFCFSETGCYTFFCYAFYHIRAGVPDVAITGKIKRQAISSIIYTKPIVLVCCGVHRVEVLSALSLKMIHRIIFTFGYSDFALYPRHSRLESLMSPLRVKSKGSNTIWCYCLLIWWAIRDSNPGPTGYEPVALTN